MKMRKRWLWLLTALVIPVGYAGLAMTGSLEPTTPPGPTMKTLDEIPPSWSQKLPTAQRFVLVLDGEGVLDKETGLVWERSPDTTQRPWIDAIYYAYGKNVGGRGGWRVPTVEELRTLVDPTQSNPALPSGHPFSNVQSERYWASTTNVFSTTSAALVHFYTGQAGRFGKTSTSYVWCVRGGHGHDAY